MLTALISLVVTAAVSFAVLLAVLRIGIRAEDEAGELPDRPPTLITGLARRLLGLHIRKTALPGPAADEDDECGTCHLAGCARRTNGGEAS